MFPFLQQPCRTRRLAAAISIVVTMAGASSACSSEGQPEEPSITDASQLLGQVALEYDSSSPTEPQQFNFLEGQMVFIAVVSDVPGQVEFEYNSQRRRVRPGKAATLVQSFDEEGSFAILLHTEDDTETLAELEVSR